MFPPATLSMAMQKGFVPPLQLIWTKKYQNKTKGSEHLIGIIQAYYLEKDKKLYIEMMTSHPKMRGQGIMSHMVKELRDEFGLSQDDLIFVDTTKEGKRFEKAKHYDLGGELEKLGITEEQRENWREEHRVKQKQKQNPNVLESALQLKSGEISQDEYLKNVKEYLPIRPFKEVPKIPTLLEIVSALDSNKVEKGIIGYTKFIEDGEYVASRLDIPAYEGYDIWVVSVHDGNKEGNVIGYGQTAYLKDITFKTSPKVGLNIATERTDKTPFARMKGSWINKDPHEVREMAVKYMNDPEWVQVGMNPYRHSWFYDKTDGMPLLTAEELVQVGALVLAKNPLKTTPDNPVFIVDKNNPAIKFEKGGLIAPNGKPSNLTPEQYKLVRTPEFKAWFGDWEKLANIKIKDSGVDDSTIEILGRDVSKVIDENGEPLVVYHGTTTDFNIFKSETPTIGTFGKGFYFTNDKNFALNYAKGINGKILSCFLKINKIFKINNFEMPIGYEKFLNMYDNKGVSRDFTNKLVNENFDGVFAKNPYNENEYVAFEQNQIKLADGTNTTFDSNNPDIRFVEGGELNVSDYPAEIQNEYKKLSETWGKELADRYLERQETPKHKKNEREKLSALIYEKLHKAKDDTNKEIKKNNYGSDKYYPILFKNEKIQLLQIGKITDAQLQKMHNTEKIKTIWNEHDYLIKLFTKGKKFEDGGMFKSNKNIEQIAKEKNVPLLYAKNQLMKGMKVESEHTNSKKVQKIIALQHLDEMINYYSKLKTIEK
jgi:hypothetical protein